MAARGCPRACLQLQDGIGLDVNVLLLALFFAGTRNGAITAATIAAADAEIATWRTEVVVALRRLRILLKDGPPGAPRPATNELRTGIKSAELSAEQIEQAWLAGWFADHVGAKRRRPRRRPISPPSRDALPAIMRGRRRVGSRLELLARPTSSRTRHRQSSAEKSEPRAHLSRPVIPGLVPGIHVRAGSAAVDGRDKPGHDDGNGLHRHGPTSGRAQPSGSPQRFTVPLSSPNRSSARPTLCFTMSSTVCGWA